MQHKQANRPDKQTAVSHKTRPIVGGVHPIVIQVFPCRHSGFHRSSSGQNADGALVAERGFTLVELLVVVSIVMIIAAFTIEAVQRASRSMRLQQAAVSYSNLLQQARIRAVRDDKYRTVLA